MAVALLGGLAAGAGGTGEAAQVTLQGTVDANWRGAYDILVRPRGSHLELENTEGLVEPNFLGFAGTGGISLETVQEIRRVPDVELAAPVAVVGYLNYTLSAPYACLTRLPTQPTLYALQLVVASSDGLGEVVLQQRAGKLLLGPGGSVLSNFPKFASNLGNLSGGTEPDGGVVLTATFQNLPPIRSPLIGVDPIAERKLLGSSAAFLDRFGAIETPDQLTVSTFDQGLIPAEFSSARLEFTNLGEHAGARPVVPILVSDRLYAPLVLHLSVQQIGRPLSAFPDADRPGDRIEVAERAAGPGLTEIGTTTTDVSSRLRPYVPPDLTMLWPGASPNPNCSQYESTTPSLHETRLSRRPAYSRLPARSERHVPTFRIKPEAVVGADGDPVDSGRAPAGERGYRLFVDTPLAISASFRPEDPYDQPFYFAPIGSFDLAKLERPTNPLNYVPYGAYDPPETRLVADPAGRPVGPTAMTPTPNPAGLIAVPPLAITDLSAAAMLRGRSPVDAVRVRVAGIDRFDEPARRRVERVATAIASLGLDVDIVAGSSPQPVEIYVPEYRVGLDPPSDLGYVAQSWTTMGAAERVTRGLGETNVALLALALLAAIVFSIAIQLTQLATRTREIAILRALGWPRGRIFRWIVGEAIVGSLIITAFGSATWFLAGGTLSALATAASVAALLPLSSLAFTHAAWRSAESAPVERGDLWTRVPRTGALLVRGPATYALRSVLAHPARSGAAGAALAIGAAATSVALAAMAAAVARAGPTLLAAASANALRPYQLALLLMVAAGSLILTIVLLKLDATDRRQEFRVLSAVGWEPNHVARMLWRHRAGLALPASVLAAVLGYLLAGAIGLNSAVVAITATLLAGSVVVWGGHFTRTSRLSETR